MNDELERIWKEVVVVELRCYPGVRMEGLGKTTTYLIQRSRRLDQDSNQAPPEYQYRVSPLFQPFRFIFSWVQIFFSAPFSQTPPILSYIKRSDLTTYTKPQVACSFVPG
jgi:hypothetical protein